MKKFVVLVFGLIGCGGAIGLNLPTEDAGNEIITVSAGNGCITQTQDAPGCVPATIDHGDGKLVSVFFCCPADAGVDAEISTINVDATDETCIDDGIEDAFELMISDVALPHKTIGLPTKPHDAALPIESSPDE
jgi:hypothetical protein